MATKFSLLLFVFLFLLLLLGHAVSLPDSHHREKLSPFAFLKHLEGCHKGDHVKGIYKLKKYLENFGYLSYPGHEPKKQTHANDNYFDLHLLSAIKTYQLNYHVKATGNLDRKTISKMMTPRCGVPDIINHTTWMRSGKKNHGPNSSLHTVSHFSFFPEKQRWPLAKTHLTYAFLPSTPAQAMRPVAQAFGKWDSATRFTFARTEDYSTADIKIGFGKGSHEDGHSFDGTGGALAHAFAPPDGRFHYDADEPWGVGVISGAFDYETVALHEIGHLLGLGHSSVEAAIMYPSISSGVTKGLHADDVQGINALYGI